MSSVAEVMKALRHLPFLPELSEEIVAHLNAEARRRQSFYAEMSEQTKTEFIDGEVIMHSPARNAHLIATGNLLHLLMTWVKRKRLGVVHSEKCLCVFPRNDYEPDIVFFSAAQAAEFGPDTMKFPIPEFIVEVLSDSTAARDRGVKFQDYEAHGVREYWIVDADAQRVEQYLLRNGVYELAVKSDSGTLASAVIAGLRIPVRAIFDDAENAAALAALSAS
jgi:Uma2 family endonuclease